MQHRIDPFSIHFARYVRVAVVMLLLAEFPAVADTTREAQHEKLRFLVGAWKTSHTIPAGDGEPKVVRGEAVIEWDVGDSWLRHEFHADFPGMGEVFVMTMMNYSPSKKM